MKKLNIKDFSGPHSYAKACLEEIKSELMKRQSIDVYDILGTLDAEQLKIFYENVISVALTDGCLGGCSFCADNAKYGISKQFSFTSLEKFAQDFYASAIPFFQKASLVLYEDTDLLDYIELDAEGNISRDFIDLLRIFDLDGEPVNMTQITRLPGWAIASFIKLVTEHSVEHFPEMMGLSNQKTSSSKSAFRETSRLTVSLHEFNKDVIDAVFSNISMKVSKKLGLNLEELKQDLMMAYTHMSSVDKVSNKLLVNLGRNYQEKPFNDIFLNNRCKDGMVLTPNGIHSVASIYPDSSNPTGLLKLPFNHSEAYFKRAIILVLNANTDCYEDNYLIAPSLPEMTTEKSVLTPDNIIKREAYRFKCLEDLIFLSGPIALLGACYMNKGGEQELPSQIELARKLLIDNAGLDGLKTDVDQLLNQLQSYLPYIEKRDVEGLTNYYFQNLCLKLGERGIAKQIAKGKLNFLKGNPNKVFEAISGNQMLLSACVNNITNAVSLMGDEMKLIKRHPNS